ncbi:MAG: LamG domain-containing protein [Candidatus Omnitrophica bacterium]|nr:LamG domain-containing protein [Candidatus Omnitrophota bacterium]
MTKKVCLTSMFGLLIGMLAIPMGAQADLLGLWEFEEGSGETIADTSGNGNDGTLFNLENGLGEGGAVWIDDPERGSVVSFDGTAAGAYGLLGDGLVPVMSLDIDFTWAFWAKQGEITGDNHIILGNRMSIDAVDFSPREFIKFTPTKFEWHSNGAGDDNLDYDDIPNDVWMHHVVVKDGFLLIYYRNGAASAARTISTVLNNPQPLFIGGDNEGSEGENWIGALDNVRIYNEALSGDEVLDLFVSEGGVASGASNWELMK